MGGQAFISELCTVLRQMFSQSSKVANISTHKPWRLSNHGLGKPLNEARRPTPSTPIGLPRLGGTGKLVQHCHGAPGMITCLADLPSGADQVFDRLLLKGGELIWRAGPLTKGSNLCHGTAGNGYALLKLYRRTGDAKWLERARAFAMHAIEQSERHARDTDTAATRSGQATSALPFICGTV